MPYFKPAVQGCRVTSENGGFRMPPTVFWIRTGGLGHLSIPVISLHGWIHTGRPDSRPVIGPRKFSSGLEDSPRHYRHMSTFCRAIQASFLPLSGVREAQKCQLNYSVSVSHSDRFGTRAVRSWPGCAIVAKFTTRER
jgi:hypothetical protein